MDVNSYAQEDTLSEKTLGEVIMSANKWEQKINEIPNRIVKVNKLDILRNNPQTSADLLGQTGTVFIQKSQLGGIYRSGNLQNVISIDALSTETAEIIFGPGSVIYGSDAIGGVMDFHTLQPRLSPNDKVQVKGSALGRYSTSNKEKTVHADINIGWKKWSVLSSLSYSKFDDLKMGKNGGQGSYLRPEYAERINNKDSIIKNSDSRVQRFSGYNQMNFLQKIRFRPNEHWDLQYSFTNAKTGDAPRYERLIQYRNGTLRFAEWYYGPMLWNMHTLQILHSKKTSLYNDARLTVAYQGYEESRIDRTRADNNRNRQVELVALLWP
jgi:hemoglobin/transferrin/lactoferrin receptor protein